MVSKQVTQQILDFIHFVFTTFRRLACPPPTLGNILFWLHTNWMWFPLMRYIQRRRLLLCQMHPISWFAGVSRVLCSFLFKSFTSWAELSLKGSVMHFFISRMPLHVDGFSKCPCSGTALCESSLFTKIQVTFHLIQATVFLRSVTSLVQTERKDLVGSSC